MNKMLQNRLKFEIKDMQNYPQFTLNIDPNHFNIWYVSFKGAEKTLYENENLKLKFVFDNKYVIIFLLY